MYRSALFLTATSIGTTLAVCPQYVSAKTSTELELVARATTVEIKLQKDGGVGTGILVNRQGDTYTLVTNRHVVCGRRNNGKCSTSPTGETYNLGLPGGKKYSVPGESVKFLGKDLDLAVIQFRSNQQYSIAQMSSPKSLQAGDKVYTAGFPLEQPGFSFSAGKAIAVVNQRLVADGGGYSVIYDAQTLPGMSGGGVFDQDGRLVAIHGWGDRYQDGATNSNAHIGSKIGFNRGIPLRWVVQGLNEIGINIGTKIPLSEIKSAQNQSPRTADEYFITGFNQLIEPGNNLMVSRKRAIQEFSKAIQLNPRYFYAFFMRAYAYAQLNDSKLALADYDQAISLNPNYAVAYTNRGNLKYNKLNDVSGALADYNQAISIEPNFAVTYVNRGLVKSQKLKDYPGALADYNVAISIEPNFPGVYLNRGNLRSIQLKDYPGALADYNKAISLNPKYIEAYYNRGIVKAILNDTAGALSDYNKVIAIDPNYADVYEIRGNLKAIQLNDLPGALADYNQAIILDPKSAEKYYNRGTLKATKLDDLSGALADFNQAIALDPKHANAYTNRGVLKAILNDTPGAIADLRQAVQLYKQQGQPELAQQASNKLRKLGVME
jgi:tetratricopeptide (TPR) repeat protein/V8-like Glu-specific endopeptidase